MLLNLAALWVPILLRNWFQNIHTNMVPHYILVMPYGDIDLGKHSLYIKCWPEAPNWQKISRASELSCQASKFYLFFMFESSQRRDSIQQVLKTLMHWLATLAQVMAWCLAAPSHYLNQYWYIFSEVLWHSHESFMVNAQATILYNEFEHYTFKITDNELRKWFVTTKMTYSMHCKLHLQ